MPGNFFRALMGRDADELDKEVAKEEEERRPQGDGDGKEQQQQKASGKNGGLVKPLVWIDCEMTGLGEN